MPRNAAPQRGDPILLFDGRSTHVEIPSKPDYSLPPRHAMTISAWIRPDTLEFPSQEGTNYVHWMGKGEHDLQEWAFRIYSYTTNDSPRKRPNRTSFYVFNPRSLDPDKPNRGTGSYEEEPILPGEWMHLVGVVDVSCTHFHKDGTFRDCDIYRKSEDGNCAPHPRVGMCDPSNDPVTPVAGTAPLRIGTRDGASHFLGAIARVRIWQRILNDAEILAIYENDEAFSREGLVAEFLLNEGAGSRASDRSELANHGTITGGSWGKA